MDWIRSELADGDTPYGKLSEEQQLYIWYVYTSLKDRPDYDGYLTLKEANK